MANEQNKDTQNTSFNVDKKSTNLTDTNQSDTSDFGSLNTATTDLGGGEFGNAGTTNPGFSNTGTSTTGTDTGSTGLSVEAAKDTARGLIDSAKSTAGQAFGAATKRATEVLDEQKGTVASGLTSVADSIKQVGENLNTTEEPNPITEKAAQYTTSLAQQIENISGYFERKDVRDMVRDVENFARRYPAYFIGGAVALGFIAARFLKSANPKQLSGGTGRTFTEGYDTGKRLAAGESGPGSSQF